MENLDAKSLEEIQKLFDKIVNESGVSPDEDTQKELESLLQDCRTKSAVIFFFGNETYDIPQAQWLNKYNNKYL